MKRCVELPNDVGRLFGVLRRKVRRRGLPGINSANLRRSSKTSNLHCTSTATACSGSTLSGLLFGCGATNLGVMRAYRSFAWSGMEFESVQAEPSQLGPRELVAATEVNLSKLPSSTVWCLGTGILWHLFGSI